MVAKKRDTIHISYNDKRYYDDISQIVEDWENAGEVRSKKVCECILTINTINKSITLNKVFNTYKMIANTLAPGFKDENDPVYKELVETIFAEVINVDAMKLSNFITDPFIKADEMKKNSSKKVLYEQYETNNTQNELATSENVLTNEENLLNQSQKTQTNVSIEKVIIEDGKVETKNETDEVRNYEIDVSTFN